MVSKLIFFFSCLPFYSLSQAAYSTIYDSILCGETKIFFKQRCECPTEKIAFVHVHENETTAVEAANLLLDSVGEGCFTTWVCQQQRYIDFSLNQHVYHFDPNRIYTEKGLKATLGFEENGSVAALNEVKKVAEKFKIQYIADKLLIVALHNNSEEGGLSVESYKKEGVYEKDASQVYINTALDADDFFYTTDLSYYNYAKELGFNVVLQNNKKVRDDGSLSVFCTSRQVPYINIEAQAGHLAEQEEMLKAVWKYYELNYKYE